MRRHRIREKDYLKKAFITLMTAAIVVSGIPVVPATSAKAAETAVLSAAIANYDFKDYTANGDSLEGDSGTITLEAVGSGTKPSLVQDEKRGQVLKLSPSDYNNRAFAKLPSNPFARKDISNGLTLNFWTSTLGGYGGAPCLIDFDLGGAANSTEARKAPGSLAFNQEMVYWNTTGQNSKFTDFNVHDLGIYNNAGWKMVTMVVTTSGITFYSNGQKISHTVQSGTEDYVQMIGDLAGTSGIASPEDTAVRLGASLATYWSCANALLDDISFYGKALNAEEVLSLYEETSGITYTDTLEKGYYLTVYSTTTNYYASKDNVAQEARSVYMAVSDDGETFDVLNNGGGVIFSKNTSGTLQITEPRVFKEDGKFKVVAPDFDTSRGYHTFTSEDGVHYYDDTLEEATALTANPLRKSKFSLMLDGENILDTDASITLGNAVQITEAEYKYITDKLGTVKNNGISGLADLNVRGSQLTEAFLAEKYPNVTAAYTDGSSQKFNIDWSGALKDVDTTKPGTVTVTGKVVQTKYLNNLKELNGSTLPEDDPDNENKDYPTNYDPETKTVYYDETKFIEGMADPMVYWDEQTGYYYMTGSYFPEDGDAMEGETPEQYDRVVLRRGKTLEELQDRSKQATIWKVGNQGYENSAGQDAGGAARYIWAPEIHRVGDKWIVYFTEGHGNGLFDIHCHALVLDGSQDPYETALTSATGISQWKDYQVRGGSGLTNAITNAFCLDMTYFKDAVNGESYVVWASTAYTNSRLYVAKVDENEPWKLTSEIVMLTAPEYGWERVGIPVNEGATVLQKDGTIYLCYSAASTGSEYAIGMLTAKAGTDLLAQGAWTKNPYPVLSSRDVDGEEGPGHNSFTVDKDGNVIFVYHARPTSHDYQMCGWDGSRSTYSNDPLTDPCRHARLKRVHWAADGTPILKMTYDNELLDQYQTVSLNINITEDGEEVDDTYLHYDFSQVNGTTVTDISGNGHNGTLQGNGYSITGDELTLPGGNNGAYVEIPAGTFDNQNSLTISLWLKNETGAGNYAAMFFGNASNYWLLNPCNPYGYYKSVITNSENTGAPYNTEYGISPTVAAQGVQGPQTDDQWALYTTVIQPGSITVYYNNILVGTVATNRNVSDFGTNLLSYIGKSTYADPFYKGGVRDVRVYTHTMDRAGVADLYYSGRKDETAVDQALSQDLDQLTLPYHYVMEDIVLPTEGTNGSKITWSSNSIYLDETGKVTLPADKDEPVTLTATLTLGGKSVTKEFPLTVLADTTDGWLTYYMETLEISPTALTGDIVLPSSIGNGAEITWSSEDEEVLTADGKVTRPEYGSGDKPATLTAHITYQGVTKEKVFHLTVKEEAYGNILTYVKSGNTDRTDALHIGYSEDKGQTYQALYNNQPILYPSQGTKMIGSPIFFRKADGTYGVIADDNHSSGYVFIYDSKDLTSFTNPRYVRLDASGRNVQNVSCVYNEERKAYEICYEANDGNSYVVYTTDFETFTLPKQTIYQKAAVNAVLPEGAIECGVFEATKEEYEAILKKYSRVVNTSISEFETITVQTGTDKNSIEKPSKATASYSDGTTKDFGVDWNETDWANVNTSKPGTYTVKGTIRQPDYGDVLVEQRADPYVVKAADGTYYFTASYPVCGYTERDNGIGYDRVVLRHADTIEGLADAEEVTIWNQADSAKAFRYIWAPEMHYIGGSWYILFTASRSGNTFDIRPSMLKCMGDDPMDPNNWNTADESNFHRVTAKAGDTGMNGTAAFTDFSLDMTYFESAGRHYLVWAEKPNNISKIYMAEIDPSEPWQLISNTMLVSTPDFAWEWDGGTIINEGPAVLKHDGKIHLCFSAAAVNYTYCVGMVTAEEGADLLNPDSWTKYPTPLLKSEDFEVEGYEPQCGPGHNSFTYDKDGNPVIVYHARPMNCSNAMDANGNWGTCEYVNRGDDALSDPCRHARAKSLNFAADGTPILNMTPSEELKTRDVTLTVAVEGDEVDATKFYAEKGARTILPVHQVKEIISTTEGAVCNMTEDGIAFTGNICGEVTVVYEKTDGTQVTVKVNVYDADNKAYVLDYGLTADLNASGDDAFGLYGIEGTDLYGMSGANLPKAGEEDAAVVKGFRLSGTQDSYQTKVDAEGAVLEWSGEKLLYTPTAFMEDADVYDYQVEVKKTVNTVIASSEDGVAVDATLTVVPASVVYYEDDFSAITVTGNIVKEGVSSEDKFQSNNQRDVYGYDAVYGEEQGIEKDLILHYDFSEIEEGTVEDGTPVQDISANDNTGYIRQTGATASGDVLTLPGGAWNSGAAYVELPKGLTNDKDAITISVWMKNETGAENYSGMFIGNDTTSYWIFNPKNPSEYGGGRFKSVITTGSWQNEYGTRHNDGPITDSNWALYTTVIDGDTLSTYYNGTLVEKETTGIRLADLGTDLASYIGKSAYGDPFYKGGVRDVRIYSSALDDAGVKELYDKTKLDGNLVLHYDFSKVDKAADGTVNAETTVSDISGNHNTGTVKQNGAVISGDVLTLPGGASNSDAAYVELPKGLTNNKQAMTISVWLKSELGSGTDYAAMYMGDDFSGGFPQKYWLLNPHNNGGNMYSTVTKGGISTEKGVSTTPKDGTLSLYTTVIESGKLTFYCDGEYIGENTATDISLADLGSNPAAYIGVSAWRDKNGTGKENGDVYYKGDVRDVRIYDRALAEDEIKLLYTDRTKETLDSAGGSTRLTADSGVGRGSISFAFTGTGFDVVGRSTSETAGISLVVRDENNNIVKSQIVDTLYADGKLYQLPVISVKDLEYGKYTVTIKAMKAGTADAVRSVVYIDGIRIYNPSGVGMAKEDQEVSQYYRQEEYGADIAEIREMLLGSVRFENLNDLLADGKEVVQNPAQSNPAAEATVSLVTFDSNQGISIHHGGSVLVEGSADGTGDLEEILKTGPNNEIYLGKGNAVAFRAVPVNDQNGNALPRTLQVELKKASDKKEASAQLTVLSEGANPQVITRKHHTAMYYEIDMSKCKQYEDGSWLVVLASTGDDMLSVTNLKCAGYGITALNDVEIARITMAADTLKLMSRAFSENEDLEVTQKELPFEDVDPEGWYIENVRYVYEKEIMKGLTDKKFGPNDYLVRAQFAVILHRMNGAPAQEYKKAFSDVESDTWYTDAILWASSVKVVNGYSNTKLFGPADNITREQIAVMMYRMAEHLGYDTSAQADISRYADAQKVDSFAEKAMRWAVSNGIIKGKDYETTLDPLGNATRAECAAIIERFTEKSGAAGLNSENFIKP